LDQGLKQNHTRCISEEKIQRENEAKPMPQSLF
jgi:hypothetical protein